MCIYAHTHMCTHTIPCACTHLHTCTHTDVLGHPCCHPRAVAHSPLCTLFAHPLFLHSPPVCTSCFYTHPVFARLLIFTYTQYLHPPPCLYLLTFPYPCCLHTRPCLHTPVFATPVFTPPVFAHTPSLHPHPRCLHSQILFPQSAPCFNTNTSRVSPLSPVCSPTRCLHSHPGVCTLAPRFHPPFAHSLPPPPGLALRTTTPIIPRARRARRPISARLVGRCRNGGAQALRAAPGHGEGRQDPAGPAGTGPRRAPGGSGAAPSSPRPRERADPQLCPSEAAGPLPRAPGPLCPARCGQGSVPLGLSCPSAG